MFVTIKIKNSEHLCSSKKELFDRLAYIWNENPNMMLSKESNLKIQNINAWLDEAQNGDEYEESNDGFTLVYGNPNEIHDTYIEPPHYSIGQILVTKNDIVAERAISCEKVTIKKGSKVTIYKSKGEGQKANTYLIYDVYMSGYDANQTSLYQNLLKRIII